MTAMKDAMTKAGVDTARAELLAKAHEVLRAHGDDAIKATPKFSGMLRKRADLLDALVLDYLRRVAANMPNVKTPSDASKGGAAPRPRPSASASTSANASPRDVSVSKHKRSRPSPRARTQDEKDAALRAAEHKVAAVRSVFEVRTIDNRFIGDLRWASC